MRGIRGSNPRSCQEGEPLLQLSRTTDTLSLARHPFPFCIQLIFYFFLQLFKTLYYFTKVFDAQYHCPVRIETVQRAVVQGPRSSSALHHRQRLSPSLSPE